MIKRFGRLSDQAVEARLRAEMPELADALSAVPNGLGARAGDEEDIFELDADRGTEAGPGRPKRVLVVSAAAVLVFLAAGAGLLAQGGSGEPTTADGAGQTAVSDDASSDRTLVVPDNPPSDTVSQPSTASTAQSSTAQSGSTDGTAAGDTAGRDASDGSGASAPEASGARGCVGNRAWVDENGNGVQDRGEPGVVGVTVELRDAAGAIVDSQRLQNGYFQLCGSPGQYTLFLNVPPGHRITEAGQGTSIHDDSDASPDATIAVVIEADKGRTRFDFGIVPDDSAPLITSPPTSSPTATGPTTTGPTRPGPSTTSTTSRSTSTSISEGSQGVGSYSDPNDYRVIPGFNPANNLPSADLRAHYDDWWASYNAPNSYYPDSPHQLFAAGGLNDSDSHGTYSYARAGGFLIGGVTEFVRVSGDPKALDELIEWSGRLKSNLRDHDGRGYPFFQYMNQHFNSGYNKPYDPKFEATDTNFLDEQMLAGYIALMAHAMHQNRDVNADAGREADFWFDYLANNWVPKWTARTTVNTSNPYSPPAQLGLRNAVGWRHPSNPRHDDTQPSFNPSSDRWTLDDGTTHHFPVREFGHPYIMSVFQYYAIAEYFQSGTGTVQSEAFPVSHFVEEARTRHDWWYQQTTPQSDGSRDWWLKLTTSSAGLRSDGYSLHVNIFLNALHWEGFGNFGRDADMESYALAWYHPNGDGVYQAGNVNTMASYSNGSGSTNFIMRSSSLLGCWDRSGTILALTEEVVAGGPLRHKITRGTNKTDFAHYNGLMSCELKRLDDAGRLG